MDEQLLRECAEKVRTTYCVEPGRMERAVSIYRLGLIKKVNTYWQVASPQNICGHWSVNDSVTTCNCPDFIKHNQGVSDGSIFVCKHLAAVYLFLKVEAEERRLNPPISPAMDAIWRSLSPKYAASHPEVI